MHPPSTSEYGPPKRKKTWDVRPQLPHVEKQARITLKDFSPQAQAILASIRDRSGNTAASLSHQSSSQFQESGYMNVMGKWEPNHGSYGLPPMNSSPQTNYLPTPSLTMSNLMAHNNRIEYQKWPTAGGSGPWYSTEGQSDYVTYTPDGASVFSPQTSNSPRRESSGDFEDDDTYEDEEKTQEEAFENQNGNSTQYLGMIDMDIDDDEEDEEKEKKENEKKVELKVTISYITEIPYFKRSVFEALPEEIKKLIVKNRRANKLPTKSKHLSRIWRKNEEGYLIKKVHLSEHIIKAFFDKSNYMGKTSFVYQTSIAAKANKSHTVQIMEDVHYEEDWHIMCELLRSYGYPPPPLGKPKRHLIESMHAVILEDRFENDVCKKISSPWSQIGHHQFKPETTRKLESLFQKREELCDICYFKHKDPEHWEQSTRDHVDAHVLSDLADIKGLKTQKKDHKAKVQEWYPDSWRPKKAEPKEEPIVPPVVVSVGLNNRKCPVCHEGFTDSYDNDKDHWKLDNAMQIRNHIIHTYCFDAAPYTLALLENEQDDDAPLD